MDDLRDRVTVMPEIELSSIQPCSTATESLPTAGRHLCPYCRGVEIARSHRRGPIEKYLLRAIHVRVYRCDDCHARFYAFSHVDASAAPKKASA
jgi:predicted RNA-binding Zn-ribbon protein involved in translation (DUF1610 family)